MTCTRRIERPEITIRSIRLPNSNSAGLEVDDAKDAKDTKSDVKNPFLTSPIERDHAVKEVDRPLYPEEKYFLSSDRFELARLDRQHIVWTRASNGDLFKAYPETEVLGIDVSKPTPPGIPRNCKFEEKDFTDQWGFPNDFDLIHRRLLFSSKHDPRQLLRQAYDSLAPGGYLEFQDMYGFPMDVDGALSGTVLEPFFFGGAVGLTRLGYTNLLSLPLYKQWMTEIGFEDVVELHGALPINGWPKGAYKAVGEMMLKNIEAMREGFSIRD
ncbi:S-adenosyl-L-methionine-dependent methyltransferase [Hypoxylon rubiginosum]|uniref:S-adenosyl-L-methionine-dependent methyltransferase n=1 Tax=Hypoxylon rubiginosum TaxID=110542 RepID=A0ACB9YXG1_9PEZI|nr:S-adenosyl-L-methionine-dependent methyltransferase [Hypoxylon rubiginosum]